MVIVVKKGTTILVRKMNKYLVLKSIFENGGLSQEEIHLRTHLSRPTIMEIVRELLEEDMIQKSGFGESSGGREPALFDINEMGSFAIGVDFEYPQVNIGILNMKREVILERSFMLPEQMTPKEIVLRLISHIEELMESFPYEHKKIIGIGFALPGIIDIARGVSSRIERIDGWVDIPVVEIFEAHFEMPVYIQNDVHLLASQEIDYRAALSDHHFIYISIRSGIGMAIVLEDEVYQGLKGNSGFLGHLTVDVNGPQCVCGRKGCLEAVAGQLSLKKKYAKQKGVRWQDFDEVDNFYDHLYQLAQSGDEFANELLMDACVYLAYGVANVIKILEIPLIVLEGGLPIILDDKYSKLFSETLHHQLFENMSPELRILSSSSNHKMIIRACSSLVFKAYIEKNYASWTDDGKIRLMTGTYNRL